MASERDVYLFVDAFPHRRLSEGSGSGRHGDLMKCIRAGTPARPWNTLSRYKFGIHVHP